jgi:hypothetical protein
MLEGARVMCIVLAGVAVVAGQLMPPPAAEYWTRLNYGFAASRLRKVCVWQQDIQVTCSI